MKLKPCLYFIPLVFLLSSCEIINVNNTEPVGIVEGLRPIYAPSEGWNEITATAPQAIIQLGKIYYKDQLIFVNERNKGIHVIDNSDPTMPVPIKFINIVGSEDIAIKGNILYADNITDLVAIDISNLDAITVTSRVEDLYNESKKNYPDGYNGYFECVDASQGIVIGWESATLENPSCLR